LKIILTLLKTALTKQLIKYPMKVPNLFVFPQRHLRCQFAHRCLIIWSLPSPLVSISPKSWTILSRLSPDLCQLDSPFIWQIDSLQRPTANWQFNRVTVRVQDVD